MQSGDVEVDETKTLKDYIVEYQIRAKNDQIRVFASNIGANEESLREFMKLNINELNINEYGRFDKLKSTVDRAQAKQYFEKVEGKTIPPHKINMKIHNILMKFILSDGFDTESINFD